MPENEVARLKGLVDLQARLLRTTSEEAAHLLDGLCSLIDGIEAGSYDGNGGLAALLCDMKSLADGD